jgi:hypothetical protein|nr:MAG TPA: zinc-ribbon containing domain protein [Caudoviricetes sp.]
MRGHLEAVALALILALCLLADGIMNAYGPAVFAAVAFVVLITAEILRRIANMPYYRTCPHCGANLDPGESCDCRAALEKEAFDLIMQLTPAERSELLARWKEKTASRTTADQSRVQKAV